jgi:hypothetical protein
MKQPPEKLFEGTYQYFQNKQNYGQENFLLELNEETKELTYRSEIMSRVETGEFFKTSISYELNPFHAPQEIIVTKSLGSHWAKEIYEIDQSNQMLKYTFETKSSTQTIERTYNSKHYITVPTFFTAGIFSLTKKVDTTSRSPVTFITSPNEWEFVGQPVEKVLWVELKAHDSEEITIAGQPIICSKFELYDQDTHNNLNKNFATLWISKTHAIPIQMNESSDTTIVATKLKKLRQEIEKIF